MADRDPLSFLHDLRWSDLPPAVRSQMPLALLDLLGVAAAGRSTPLAQIITRFATEELPGVTPMLFDGRHTSKAGAALAAGMMIDSLDGHDGFNPSKGHIGCALIATIYGLCQSVQTSGREVLTCLALGYEIGARLAIAQHATTSEYQTSGSWGAVMSAAIAARLMALGPVETGHALGIADYHGPRSPMMRCVDHPTMLKDGSGWGAFAGVSAARLAALGFTGAPAPTLYAPAEVWGDLGQRWYGLEQYYKPYPVCRWAQAPIEAILALRHRHGVTAQDVARIRIISFHEATRLATNRPDTTEEAQYSTAFPCAVAMVRGDVTPSDISGEVLRDPEILRLSQATVLEEDAFANDAFPLRRFARVILDLRSGQRVESDWTEPRWDHLDPPDAADLGRKFDKWAGAALGPGRGAQLRTLIERLAHEEAAPLWAALSQPINR